MYGRLLVIQVLSIAVVAVDSFIDNLITSAFLGVAAIGASGVIGQAALVPAAFSGVVSMGLYSVCSEAVGAKKFHLGGKELSAALALVTIVYLPLVLVLELFSDPLCQLLCQNTTESFIATSSAYVRGLAPSLYLSTVVPYLMYTCQMNRKSHWCSFAVAALFVINIGGDFFVTLCTNLGMLGIGLVTTTGAAAAALILLGPVVSRKSQLHLRWGMGLREFCTLSWKMISFGLPSAVTTLANAFAGMWVNYLLLSTGSYVAVGAYTCATSVIGLLYTPASSLWYCTAIIAGVLLGKNMHAAIRQLPAVFTKVACMATVVPFILALLLAQPLCSAFLPGQPEVTELAALCTCVLAFNLLPNALVTCFQSLLRSTGHRIAAVVLPAVYLVGFLPLLSWPLSVLFGAAGICAARVAAYCLGIMAFCTVCVVRRKASPAAPATYVFLPPLEPGYAEGDFALAERSQVEAVSTQVEGFFASLEGAQDSSLLPAATAHTLNTLLEGTRRRSHCWVHAATKENQPWVQVTCTRKALNAQFVEGLSLGGANATYLDFSMLGAVELYTGEPPYDVSNEKDRRE